MSEAPKVCANCEIATGKTCEKSDYKMSANRFARYIPGPGCPFVRLDLANAKNERLRAAATGLVNRMQNLLDDDMCDCEDAHRCGRTEAQRDVDHLRQALDPTA